MIEKTEEIVEIAPQSMSKQAWDIISRSHTHLTRGLTWGIYTVNLAVWLWPDNIYNQACGVDGRKTYQDMGIQIFVGTAATRIILMPILDKVFSRISKSGIDNINTLIEVTETSLMEASGIFVYIGGNPLLLQVMPSRFMSIIPAAMLSSIPLGNLLYKLFVNQKYYRGALQDYYTQFSNPCAYIPLTILESVAKGAMMGSLALKLSESIINTVVDAMLVNNLPQDLVNKILGSSMGIASIIGMLSVINPAAWMSVNAAAAAANILFASYNFPLSVADCIYPDILGTVAGYLTGGWTLTLLSGSVALSYFALPTAIKTITADETRLSRCTNYCFSFFRDNPQPITENSNLISNPHIKINIESNDITDNKIYEEENGNDRKIAEKVLDINNNTDVKSSICSIQ